MLFLSFDIKSLPETNSFRRANILRWKSKKKSKVFLLFPFFFSFFPLVVFNLGILFMEQSLLPTCLLLLHLSPFRFLKIAKNTEFLSPKNTLTGKKGMHEVKKKIYIYTVSPATWLTAHVWASVLSLDTSTDTCQIQRGRNKGHCWFSAEPMNTVRYLWEVGFATISLLIITGLWRVGFSLYYLKLKLLS